MHAQGQSFFDPYAQLQKIIILLEMRKATTQLPSPIHPPIARNGKNNIIEHGIGFLIC